MSPFMIVWIGLAVNLANAIIAITRLTLLWADRRGLPTYAEEQRVIDRQHMLTLHVVGIGTLAVAAVVLMAQW